MSFHLSDALNFPAVSLTLFRTKSFIEVFGKSLSTTISCALRALNNLFTKWLGNSWEDFTTQHQDLITKTFNRCGMFNDIHGRVPNYSPPAKDDPLEIVEKQTRKRESAKINKNQKAQYKFLCIVKVFVNTTILIY